MYTFILIVWLAAASDCMNVTNNVIRNKMMFPYGVNFKYNGKLSHNIARVWVVTKFPLPDFRNLSIPEMNLEPDCNFRNRPGLADVWTDRYEYIIGYLSIMCREATPLLALLEQKKVHYKGEIERRIQSIEAALPALRSAGRTKRFVGALPALAGLVTLAVEGISSYLQSKRNKAMATALNAMQDSQVETWNRLNRHKKDLLLYGQFSINSTNEIVKTLNDIYARQSFVENMMTNLSKSWKPTYLSNPAGASLYANHMNTYISTASEKYNNLMQELLQNLETLLRSIRDLSKGRLPIDLITPAMLSNFTETVGIELGKSHPNYVLAFPNIHKYYDINVVTFGIEERNLIITFPIFIRPLNSHKLTLYQIETTYVPIEDLNSEMSSFSRLKTQKPYFAANMYHYIQLEVQELQQCKEVQQEFYCEEIFMIKHSSSHTCESALFYDRPTSLIKQLCDFELVLNNTVPPSILDGGTHILLANMAPDKDLKCTKQIKSKLPTSTYLLTNRSILCHCSIESAGAYIAPELGACGSNPSIPIFRYTYNLAFYSFYKEMRNQKQTQSDFNYSHLLEDSNPIPPFPMDMNEFGIHDHITNLKEIAVAYETKIGNDAEIEEEYPIMKIAIEKYLKDLTSLSSEQTIIIVILSLTAQVLLFAYIIWLSFKFKKMQKTISALSVGSVIPLVRTQTTEPAQQVICQSSWLTYILTACTIAGILFYVYKLSKARTFLKGYLFKRGIDIYLVLSNDTRYVPIKLRSMTGYIHNLCIKYGEPLVWREGCLANHIAMERKCPWDELDIYWGTLKLMYNDSVRALPQTVLVPLVYKVSIRYIMKGEFKANLVAKQGNTWMDIARKQECEDVHATSE